MLRMQMYNEKEKIITNNIIYKIYEEFDVLR